MARHVGAEEKLRKQVLTELGQALKFTGRAANLLRHGTGHPRAVKAAEGLEQVTASIIEHIDSLFTRR